MACRRPGKQTRVWVQLLGRQGPPTCNINISIKIMIRPKFIFVNNILNNINYFVKMSLNKFMSYQMLCVLQMKKQIRKTKAQFHINSFDLY